MPWRRLKSSSRNCARVSGAVHTANTSSRDDTFMPEGEGEGEVRVRVR